MNQCVSVEKPSEFGMTPCITHFACLFFMLGMACPVSAETLIRLDGQGPEALKEAVLFPFDHHSIPFRHGLQLELKTAQRYGGNPIIPQGGPQDPDNAVISYYGTTLEVNGQYRMYYIASCREKPRLLRVCYAVSEDGFHWTKSKLGLVAYAGSKQNNLVGVDFGGRLMSCNVIYEPHDPNPNRKFKMFCEVESEQSRHQGNVAFSADGLRWTLSPKNPVTHTRIENTGLVKRNGCYLVNGQNAGTDRAFQKRVLLTLASYDFEHWTTAGMMGFRRDNVPPRPVYLNYQVGPQVHLGAGLWDRGNVILGFYGQWNAPYHSDDRRDMRMDIGLVVSSDGMSYHEPIPDFRIMEAREEGWSNDKPAGDPPRLAQGQGCFNIGDKTVTYYSLWGSGGNADVRAAYWRRDRLGHFHATRSPIEGQTWIPEVGPHFISAPIQLGAKGAMVFINASHLSEHSRISVEILNERFEPLPGYLATQCLAWNDDSSFELPVRWQDGRSTVTGANPIRVRVNYEGLRLEDARVHAVYVRPGR